MNNKQKWVVSAALITCACSQGSEQVDETWGSTNSALTAADVPLVATELLGRPTDRSVTVSAIAGQSVEVFFEYGTAPGATTDVTPSVVYPNGMIRATIGGLVPATRYYYRMRYRPEGSIDQHVVGPERSFHTQRATGSTFTFAVQSDSHQGFGAFYSDALYATTLQNILASQPDFMLDLGDTFSLDASSETLATVAQKYLDQRAYFGLAAHSTPVFLVLGNHENEEGWNLDDMGSNVGASLPVLGANARKRYFVNPVPNGFYGGSSDPLVGLDGDGLRENYYAFEWGDALFVAIDPFSYTMRKPFAGTMGGEKNDEVVGNRWDWTLGRQQYLWLKDTLERSDRPFKFVFTHHLTGGTADYSRAGARGAKYCEWGGYDTDGVTNSFASQRPGWEMPIHQLLVQNGVTALFHGHDHVYATEMLDGVVYQCVPHAANDDYGTGFASNQTDYAGALALIANSGYVRVTVGPGEARFDYVRSYLPGDGTNGTVAHTYTVTSCAGRDSDGDGTNDCTDGCPTDPQKVAPGTCGCGASDADGDGDGTADCQDGCPTDPQKTAPGACGCGVADTDANANGIADCLETTCTGATLASNDADGSAPVGTAIRFTAAASCGGATPTYQFRLLRPGSATWTTVRNWSTAATHNWATTGLATGRYSIQVNVRRQGATVPYETRASGSFTLTRRR